MKTLFGLCLLIGLSAVAQAQANPFLGRWDISGVGANANYVYWLEVKEENGKLTGTFLNRSGSVEPVSAIQLDGSELVFSPRWTSTTQPKPVHRAHVEEGRLLGLMKQGDLEVAWIGERPPMWKDNYNANGRFRWGTPVVLFDGKSLEHWEGQVKGKELGWSIGDDGAMTNQPHANNLVSRHRFQDFKIHCEYKVEERSNSGIYLRGRYELQVLGDFGKPTESHGHMALYSRVAPSVNASLPAGQWQTMEATIVGNRLTVILNGKKVQDNIVIDGITGGALDSNEGQPGPIMIQGDHEKVWYRKIVVTPILN